jgi:uncharacterized membrane protein
MGPVAAPASGRQLFLDAFRGLALVAMVLNHTGRWWLERPMGWPRYHLVYVTVTVAAPIFLFLVGFCLPLSYRVSAARGLGYGRVVLRALRRGLGLVVAGWALTLLVFPDEPLFEGGVLQTIGLSIVLLTLVLPLGRHPAWRWVGLAAGAAVYATFVLAQPALKAWLPRHPVVAEVWFTDFPLWPWFAIVLVGGVLGWAWAALCERGGDRTRYFTWMAAAGVLCLLAFLPLELARPDAWHFTSRHDLVLNQHWNPGGVTTLWILGVIFTGLPATFYVVEVRGNGARWLVLLGQQALVLYFVHQVIVLTILRQRLGVLFTSWWLYALANALLVAALVPLARLWPEVKRRDWRSLASARAGAE